MRLTWLIGMLFVAGCGASDNPAGSKADESSGGQGGGGSTAGGSIDQGGDSNGAGSSQGMSGSPAAGGSQGIGGSPATGGSQGTAGTKDAGGTQDARGSGGSGGTETGPAPKVLACDGVSAAKGWEVITPPGNLGDVCAVQLDPLNVGTIYVQMHKGGNGGHAPTDGLYKSTDCGSSWNRVMPGKNGRDNIQGEVNIFSGSIVALLVDPVDPGVLYAVSNYGPPGVWKSTNGGVDWEQTIPVALHPYLPTNGWFNALSMDPTDHLHLVGATHNGCSGAYGPNCLAETRDGGKTWRLFHAPQTINEATGPYIHDSHTMVYASGQNGLHLTKDDYPDNATPTWTQVAGGANGGDTGLFAYQAKNGKYYLGSDFGIVAGSSDFTSWVMDGAAPNQILFIVGDGEKLFAAARGGFFYTTPEANPSTWTKLAATGNPPSLGGRWLLNEKTHHILYSSIWETGIYRMVTP